jgi:hypothetical protein
MLAAHENAYRDYIFNICNFSQITTKVKNQ